jgi:hypothetical protein
VGKRERFNLIKETIYKIMALVDMIFNIDEPDISQETKRTLVVIDDNGGRRIYKEY